MLPSEAHFFAMTSLLSLELISIERYTEINSTFYTGHSISQSTTAAAAASAAPVRFLNKRQKRHVLSVKYDNVIQVSIKLAGLSKGAHTHMYRDIIRGTDVKLQSTLRRPFAYGLVDSHIRIYIPNPPTLRCRCSHALFHANRYVVLMKRKKKKKKKKK